ncbi:MAG TPA: sigma-70 family RNA polymerase sigma factor [Jatrophihabitans sp.]|nr:sigma-70 family RNA polymerase sigma factor [Jatrophihabitans sp.]
MSSAGVPADPAFVQLSPGQSWRALNVLVARAIASARPDVGRMLTESASSAVQRPTPGQARSADLSNEVTAAGLPAPDEPPGPGGVEADHAETWALVRAVQDGDAQAFGQLYDRYVNQVFRFIYYRVNDRQLAEDFTSETFLRALRRITTINYQGRDIGAWFMTIARNIVFDHTKSARFRLEINTSDSIEPDEHGDSPEAAVLAHLTNTRLMEAVNQLNDEQKECIVLRFLQGLSVAETAAVMGKNDGAIKALQHRAIKRLAGMVADDLR